MTHATTLHLKVDVDNTAAAELVPRLRAAIHDALETASRTGIDDAAGAAAYAAVIEILQVRKASPAEAAIARVRALHRNEYESCAWCSTNDRHAAWPCPTIRALDGEEPTP